MSSRGVEAELVRTADELAGAAQIEVTGGSLGIPDTLLDEVAAVPGVSVAAPFVEAGFRILADPARDLPLYVIGVDLLADPSVRSYSLGQGEASIDDPMRLIAVPNSVLLSYTLAKRLGVVPGDSLAVRFGHKQFKLVVRGVLSPGGVADAFGGQIAVMDVYSLQSLLQRQGWLDRVDIVVKNGHSVADVMQSVREAVAGRATVRPSATRDLWVENVLATLRFIVAALVVVAVIAASLLAYGATSLFVDRRMQELALLRLAGMEGPRIRKLLYMDVILLAVAGCGIGFAFALPISQTFLDVLSGISGFLQNIQIQRLEVRPVAVLAGVGVGLLVALIGVVEPARRAILSPPLEVLIGARGGQTSRTKSTLVGAGSVGLTIVWITLSVVPVGLPPLPRVAALLIVGVLALTMAVWNPLPRLLHSLRPVFEHVLPGIGRLAGASLVARPAQTATTIACVAGVLAGVTISLSLVGSVTRTLDTWTASQFRGGIFVTAGTALTVRAEELISPETLATIRETPGVRAVYDQITATILYRGEEVLLSAGSMGVLANYGHLPLVSGDSSATAQALTRGEVVVSDGFRRRFGVDQGAVINLDTPRGERPFRVAGVIRDYAGPAGSLTMDIATFDKLWPRKGSRNAVLWTEGSSAQVVGEILHRVGDRQTLFLVYGNDLERFATRLLDRFARLLKLVALMTAALGGIAILNMLLGAVAARTREIAILRSAGATRSQVQALILIDGTLLSLFGGFGGILIGLACAYPIVSKIIPAAVGWSLTFSVRIAEIGAIVTGLPIVSLLASYYPAALAARTPIREAFIPE
jgi:putative ABC transport system permease protein